MAKKVKCYYCGEMFDPSVEPAIKAPLDNRRYCHKKCFESIYNATTNPIEDREKLIEHVKELFHYSVLPYTVEKQIDGFAAEKKYSYNGMLKALKYFYEIKHADKEKANGRVSILPFIYSEALEYYYLLEKTKANNKKKMQEITTPIEDVVLVIPSPKREPMLKKKKQFQFLEEDYNE